MIWQEMCIVWNLSSIRCLQITEKSLFKDLTTRLSIIHSKYRRSSTIAQRPIWWRASDKMRVLFCQHYPESSKTWTYPATILKPVASMVVRFSTRIITMCHKQMSINYQRTKWANSWMSKKSLRCRSTQCTTEVSSTRIQTPRSLIEIQRSNSCLKIQVFSDHKSVQINQATDTFLNGKRTGSAKRVIRRSTWKSRLPNQDVWWQPKDKINQLWMWPIDIGVTSISSI